MTLFTYRARDKTGGESSGTRDARDRFELARVLRREGYTLVSAKQKDEKKKRISLPLDRIPFINRVSIPDKIIFSKNLGVMIAAGLPLTRSLEALSHESRNPRFKAVIQDVIDQIRQGHTLSESLARHQKIFPPLYVAMIESGEKTGKLRESLTVLSTQLQADYDLIRKIRGAATYPGIILLAMVGIGIFMMLYVVPTLVTVFEELNVELPASTRFIIVVSKFFLNYGFFAAIGAVAFVLLLIQGFRTPIIKRFLDHVFIRFPLLGPLVKKFNAARTARTLSSLISSGVPILDAIDITSRVVQNHLYSRVLLEARAGVQKGETISKVFLKNEKLYPTLMGEMLAVGEETGETSHMLIEVALFYEGQVSDATRDLSTIIEPLLMVLIGGAVGFFAVSMIQPMYSLSSSI